MEKWRGLLSILMFGIILTLTACDEYSADLSDYPQAVQDGEMSAEFYDSAEEFYEKATEFTRESSEQLSSKNYDELKITLLEFNSYLDSINMHPETSMEEELSKIFDDYIYAQKDFNMNLEKWVDTGDGQYQTNFAISGNYASTALSNISAFYSDHNLN